VRYIDLDGDRTVLAEGPVPTPGPDEVLIKVAAAGVNRPDLVQRAVKYPPPPGASPIMGLEVAGTLETGERVCALLAGGGYAEYAVAPRVQCLPIPEGLSFVEAAALPETYFTVWSNVFQRGGLKAGEKFLVHGGTSGIGTTAIQLAKAFGAVVYTTAGSDEKVAACRALGADVAINYREQDFVEVAKGVNLILDMVGGDYTARNLKALAVDGRLVQIAFLRGSKLEIDLMPVMLKRLTLTGSTLRSRPVAEKGAIARELEQHVWPLLAAGRVKPVIYREFALAEVDLAHRLMESSAHIGKIVLTV
jgi:putative PIG3 family NAD(P)H quinone oxidoreductase